jgi:hypothetical protein
LFILALRRAKSLEIGVDEDHNAGWDYLIKQAEDLLERGFALASPHDVYAFVKAIFEVFSLEHRDAVNNARDVTDYPSFENLADEDDTVSSALTMLTDGNRLRTQVDRIVEAKLAQAKLDRTPSKGRNKKRSGRPSPTSSESSTPPSPKRLTRRERNAAARVKAAAADKAAKRKKAAADKAAAALTANFPPAGAPYGLAAYVPETREARAARHKAIGIWITTPEAKDAAGNARCFLHHTDPTKCPTPCKFMRSHEPAV